MQNRTDKFQGGGTTKAITGIQSGCSVKEDGQKCKKGLKRVKLFNLERQKSKEAKQIKIFLKSDDGCD